MSREPLSVGEVYYSRQVWLYNLTFVRHGWSQNRDNVFIYTWLETESGKGSNQIASALNDFIAKLESEFINTPSYLRLYNDACPGQNKNSTVMVLLMHRAKKKQNLPRQSPMFFQFVGTATSPLTGCLEGLRKNTASWRTTPVLKSISIYSENSAMFVLFSRTGRFMTLQDKAAFQYFGIEGNDLFKTH